jgi:hypothetical protein
MEKAFELITTIGRAGLWLERRTMARVVGGFVVVLPTGQPVEISGKKNHALLTYFGSSMRARS